MQTPDMRRPGPACHSGNQAKCKNTHTQYTAARLLADSMGAGIIGVCLAWGVLEWADHSYHLAERAGRRFQAAAAAQGTVSATSASPSPANPNFSDAAETADGGGNE